MVHGPPGVGKTELAASFPSPFFIIDPQEQGINILIDAKRVKLTKNQVQEIHSFPDLLAVGNKHADKLYTNGIRTVVFDSCTGFQRICFDFHCNKHFDGDMGKEGFMSFFQGPDQASQTDWVEYLESMDALRSAGIDVVLIAHVQVKPYSNPEGPDYDRFTPFLDKRVWQQTHRWANPVLFYNYYYDVEKKRGQPKAKAVKGSQSRMIYTEWSPTFDAKNSFGLPPFIEAGDSGQEAFKALCDAFPK